MIYFGKGVMSQEFQVRYDIFMSFRLYSVKGKNKE